MFHVSAPRLGEPAALLRTPPLPPARPPAPAATLYTKNQAEVTEASPAGQLLAVQSPISAQLLTVQPHQPGSGRRAKHVKDPISGVPLRLNNGSAEVTAFAIKQPLARARNVYVRRCARRPLRLPMLAGGRQWERPQPHAAPRCRDVDATIHTLRQQTAVNKYTNEKICGAGAPTGLRNANF